MFRSRCRRCCPLHRPCQHAYASVLGNEGWFSRKEGGMQWAQAAMPPSSAQESLPQVTSLCAPVSLRGTCARCKTTTFSLLLDLLSDISKAAQDWLPPTVLPKGQVGVVPCKVSRETTECLSYHADTPMHWLWHHQSSVCVCVCVTVLKCTIQWF